MLKQSQKLLIFTPSSRHRPPNLAGLRVPCPVSFLAALSPHPCCPGLEERCLHQVSAEEKRRGFGHSGIERDLGGDLRGSPATLKVHVAVPPSLGTGKEKILDGIAGDKQRGGRNDSDQEQTAEICGFASQGDTDLGEKQHPGGRGGSAEGSGAV